MARLETHLSEALVASVPVRRAVARAAEHAPEAPALDLGFALGLVAAATDRPIMAEGSRDPEVVAALYRAHVALQGDIYALLVRGEGTDCAALVAFWRAQGESYFSRD